MTITNRVPNIRYTLAVLLLALFSFLMSALVSRTVYERLPHLEDEMAYLFQARTLARGDLVIESPRPARAYWQPFVVDRDGKRFGKYPLGWPILLAGGVIMGQPWVINAFLSALIVALVYRLGRDLFNADTGLMAAALAAFSPMALLLNGTLMGHTAALFAATLFMWAYRRMERSPAPLRWGLLAGLALGLLVANRPLAGVAVAAPFIAYSGVRLIRTFPRRGGPERPFEKPSPHSRSGDMRPRSARPLSEGEELKRPLLPFSTREKGPGDEGKRTSQKAFQTLPYNDAPEGDEPYAKSSKPPRPAFLTALRPLLALAAAALLVSLLIPIYQYAATGDPAQNLYTLVWSYDRVGFGEGRGRNVHTLEKGIRQTRWDLSLAAADLFGWQLGGMPDESQRLRTSAVYWPVIGMSWMLIPFGLVIGLGRRWPAWAVWLAVGAALFFLTTTLPPETQRDPAFAMLWMGAAAVWMLVPFVFLLAGRPDDRAAWTWLLLAAPMCLVGLHIAYWIGSQLYSTRYYFEGLGGLAILSAVPLAHLARRRRWPVYAALAVVLVFSLYAYSTPRITPLYRFNWVSPQLIEAVEARREDDRPVLVLAAGSEVRWRALGPLMAVTSPYLDSDIVVAWDTLAEGVRESILARFPDRQVIEMTAQANTACFGGQLAGECYGAPPGS